MSNSTGPDAVTSAFMSAMDDFEKSLVDEKGVSSLSEWGVGDQRVAFFFKLCRGLSREKLQEFIRNVVSESLKRGKEGFPEQEIQGYVDLFVLMIQTRDIDEGKGERDLFYWFLVELHRYFPDTVLSLLPLIPGKYGSWKDVKLLLEILQGDLKSVKGEFRKTDREKELESLTDSLMSLYETQLWDDDSTLTQREGLSSRLETVPDGPEKEELKNQLSELVIGLCAKWCPREGGHFGWIGKRLAIRMFHDKTDVRYNGSVCTDSLDDAKKKLSDARKSGGSSSLVADLEKNVKAAQQSCYKRYRQLCARLNKHIKTSEILMCDKEGKWNQLVPSSIPARCLKIHRKAFMNKTKKGEQRSSLQDRIECASNFTRHLEEAIKNPSKKKVHGKNLMPHELVKIYFDGVEKESDLTLEAQWVNLRESLKESGALGKFVVMSDVSGSMSGIPMMVSIAMGILISELNHPAFRNRFLTFAENPTWHVLGEHWSLFEKVESSKRADWGGTTDFEKAMNLIITRCVEGKVPVSEVEEMMFAIFSDMQFNQATGRGYYGRTQASFSTKFEKIASAWKAAGYYNKETGEAIVPRMIFWNLRGDTMDFPCEADVPNVDMVSGFSANGLKAFMTGEDMKENCEDPKQTPYEGMRKQLDVERYGDIRELCESTGEIVSKVTGLRYTCPVLEEEEEV